MITNKQVSKVVSLLDEIVKEYKEESEQKKRDWRTYEQRVAQRLKVAFRELKPLVHEAVQTIQVVKEETRGAKPILSLEQKVLTLLLKHLIGKSNRTMSFMVILFSWLSDVDVSYKTIERLYDDPHVLLALHNLHVLLLKKKGVKSVNCGGDGTGYSLTVKKNYCSEAQKLKDKVKENASAESKKKKRRKALFMYSFELMDIDTRMYIGCGSSMKSEKQAFLKAIEMVKSTEVILNSVRLDRYFSGQRYTKLFEEKFGNVKMFVIPKKGQTIRGSPEWKKMLQRFVDDTKEFLTEYYQRNQSESGFSEDKKRVGWKLGQKRSDRLDTANTLTHLWHNLYWLG